MMSSLPFQPPHIVLVPSGIGPSTQFFRLAVMLVSRNCTVTFINIQSEAPAPDCSPLTTFFDNHQEINRLDFDIHTSNTSNSTTSDPFITRFEGINRSLNLLGPVLSSLLPPLSAIFSDFVVTATLTQLTADLNIPLYILSTTSARFFSMVAYLPVLMSNDSAIFSDSSGNTRIPGLDPVSNKNIPPTWLADSPSNYLLTAYLLPNARSLSKVKGVLLNTFDWFELETITALNSGRVLDNLPPLFPVGPIESHDHLEKGHYFSWLNDHSAESVVYVNFGSRESMSKDQIKELENGLQICGYPFLWIREFSDNSFLMRTKNDTKVTKGVKNPQNVLAHHAVGAFVNECDWESVMDAARHGVPMLAWPQHGDQKMNAEVVEKAGLGVWVKEWDWGGEKLVAGENISEMLRKLMGDLNIRCKAKTVGREAKNACEIGGSSQKVLGELIEMFRGKNGS
ncbi:UDP-glycosyltransferase 71C3 [Forsythia ovata]|uniref:UDP-glycosyltransferase 71C3 n=1 Tax=Forsythia ovata TaxID=205694 RepID=A0ABD1UUF1_9LAMI